MSQLYSRLIAKGNTTGEVVDSNRFLITVAGLFGARLGSEVVFSTGVVGIVTAIHDDIVTINTINSESVAIGTQVVIYRDELVIHPSEALLGRVVDPLLNPLDGGVPLLSRESRPVFTPAPAFSERLLLDQQLETGVTVVDTLFPIVMGQRIALMGDPKSGKTSFALQAATHQALQGKIVVLVLIAKRQTEIEQIITSLRTTGALKNVVILVADSFSPLPLTYLAPYSGCTVAEYFWHSGRDTIIIYDDLLNHAKVYREMSLIAKAPPGRESYPGDMFYRHSSLLERAGRLKVNGATLTALPLMTTSNNDITSYLSTNIISITDGQLVFDTEELQRGIMPPVHTGLSVSRVGGRAQTGLQKDLAQDIFRALAAYRQSSQFSHFGQDLPEQYRVALRLGDRIRLAFNQTPTEFFTLQEQQVILKAIFMADEQGIDISRVKAAAKKLNPSRYQTTSYEDIAKKILAELPGGKV